jgi:hypothetical protein
MLFSIFCTDSFPCRKLIVKRTANFQTEARGFDFAHFVYVGGERLFLKCGHQGAYCSSPRYMSVEVRWNETDRGNPKNSEINLSQCRFVHHKSHTD